MWTKSVVVSGVFEYVCQSFQKPRFVGRQEILDSTAPRLASYSVLKTCDFGTHLGCVCKRPKIKFLRLAASPRNWITRWTKRWIDPTLKSPSPDLGCALQSFR